MEGWVAEVVGQVVVVVRVGLVVEVRIVELVEGLLAEVGRPVVKLVVVPVEGLLVVLVELEPAGFVGPVKFVELVAGFVELAVKLVEG